MDDRALFIIYTYGCDQCRLSSPIIVCLFFCSRYKQTVIRLLQCTGLQPPYRHCASVHHTRTRHKMCPGCCQETQQRVFGSEPTTLSILPVLGEKTNLAKVCTAHSRWVWGGGRLHGPLHFQPYVHSTDLCSSSCATSIVQETSTLDQEGG